jgi:hypothetical protein
LHTHFRGQNKSLIENKQGFFNRIELYNNEHPLNKKRIAHGLDSNPERIGLILIYGLWGLFIGIKNV